MHTATALNSDNNRFGVTMILLDCAFCAEVRRDFLSEIMSQIDTQLTDEGAPDDDAVRVEMVMSNVANISAMVANNEIEHDDGVADIAYSFIYCLGKTVGFDQVPHLRGLTGTFLQNVLSLNPCLGEQEYQKEMAILQKAMESSSDEWEIDFAPPPTVH